MHWGWRRSHMKKTVSAHVYNTIERYPQILKMPKVEKAMGNLKCWMALRVNRGFDSCSYGKYPIIYRVPYIPGGCLGFQPSTVVFQPSIFSGYSLVSGGSTLLPLTRWWGSSYNSGWFFFRISVPKREVNSPWNRQKALISYEIDMGVSKNRGTPKSSIFIGFFHYKSSILGVPLFLETPIYCTMNIMIFDVRCVVKLKLHACDNGLTARRRLRWSKLHPEEKNTCSSKMEVW